MPNLYTALSKLRLLKKNYSLKFLFIAFLGIHIPLITIVVLVSAHTFTLSTTYILVATLLATLSASALTLFFLNKLLWPLREAKAALGGYLSDKAVPELPIHFEDEAGILLKELQHTIEHLDYLIGEKKDVITILSHDIRTPFNQVLGLSSMILLETDRAAINQHAMAMKDLSIKNLVILNDILKLLKADHPGDGENSIIELTGLATAASHHMQPTAKAKSITIQVFSGKPLYVSGNKVMLAEAFANLLSNAIKFSYPGGDIGISIEEKNTSAVIEIKDQGVGISEEDKHMIFNRFTTAGKQGTSGEHSSGVGLYLSRKIITKSKGQLTVFSDGKDKGSTFIITLPLADPAML